MAQVAGQIQGLLGGDFGDLGKSSLDHRQISDLLGLVMNDVEKMVSAPDSRVDTRTKRGRQVDWHPLDLRQRRHLELGARLMACAQRRYLAQAEWQHDEDLNLLNYLKQPSGADDDEWIEPEVKETMCPTNVLADSPWMKYIIESLCAGISLPNQNPNPDIRSYALSQDSPVESPNEKDGILVFPVLKSITDRESSSSQTFHSLLSILPIIGACAESFPGGGCWTSATFSYWHRLSPSDPPDSEVLYYQGCCPNDQSLVVHLLGTLLEVHGDPGGDSIIQSWLLVVLSRLTVSSSILFQEFSTKPDELQGLRDAWRNIWKCLFRSDFRYLAYTELNSENGLGELVLTLLSGIVKSRCTDPLLCIPGALATKQMSFLHENQPHVWGLPLFNDFRSVSSPLVFQLTCSILQVVGLSDLGTDKINLSLCRGYFGDPNTSSPTNSSNIQMGRRWRLLYLAMACLEHCIKSRSFGTSTDSADNFIFAATSCIISLVNGNAPMKAQLRFALGMQSNPALQTKSSSFGLALQLTTINLSDSMDADRTFLKGQDACFNGLWPSVSGRETNFDMAPVDCFSTQFDVVSAVASKLHCRLRHVFLEYADFVSEPESDVLRKQVLTFFDKSVFSLQKDMLIDGDSNLDFSRTERQDSSNPGDIIDTQPLSIKVLALKSLMSVKFFCRDSLLDKEVGEALPLIIPFLEQACSKLTCLSDSPDEFFLTSSGLLHITRALLALLSSNRSNTSPDSLSGIIGQCKSILENYLGRTRRRDLRQFVAKASKEKKAKINRSFDLLDEEEEDVLPSLSQNRSARQSHLDDSESDADASRKRRGRQFTSPSGVTKKRRLASSEEYVANIPNHECAQVISAILIALEPSPSNCELVCQALLGTDLHLEETEGDIDLRSAGFCARLVCRKELLLYELSKKKLFDTREVDADILNEVSVPEIFVRVVNLVRSCAGPLSPFCSFGNDECARILQVANGKDCGFTLSEKETQKLVDLLKNEDGMQTRPYLRCRRIRAATFAFQAGSDTFHRLFDRNFPNLVQVALRDPSVFVRRSASVAVGAALRSMDEQKTTQSVLKLIVPITEAGDMDEVVEEFGKWYQQAGFSCLPDDDIASKTEWIDAMEVMESDTIYCKSIIAASARSFTVFHKMLFEIIMVSCKRPDLEFVCFQALDRIAAFRKFSTVQDMIDAETEGILKLWIESDHLEFPLLLSAPNILRRINCCVWYSKYAKAMPTGSETDKAFDFPSVRLDASKSFLSRFRHFLTPIALIQAVSKSSVSPSVNSDMSATLLASDLHLQAICTMIFGGDDFDRGINILMKKYVADIQAFCKPMLQCEQVKFQQMGQGVLDLLVSMLSPDAVESKNKKKHHIIIRRIFQVFGKSEILADFVPTEESAYFEAINTSIMEESTSANLGTGDVFLHVGTNATENLIRFFRELDKQGLAPHQMKSCWRTINLQCKFIEAQIQRQDHDCIQLGFCIHVFTEAMMKTSLISLRPKLLVLLKHLLNEALTHLKKKFFKLEISPVIQRLVGACFYMHEMCQQDFLVHCRNKTKESHFILRRSCGLRLLCAAALHEDAWGWNVDTNEMAKGNDTRDAIYEYAATVDKSIRESITATFEVLEWIFDNASDLDLDHHAFVSTAPPYAVSSSDLEALESYDRCFCAQNLAKMYIETQGHSWGDVQPDIRSLIQGLKLRLGNRHSWMKKVSQSSLSSQTKKASQSLGSLNMDQRMCMSELAQLERTLKSLSNLSEVPVEELEYLVRDLSFVCGASCPVELRVAASRCLGEIKPKVIANLCTSENSGDVTDWIGAAVEENKLFGTMFSHCIERLGLCLKSADANIASAAADTLETLFATNIGEGLWKMMKSEDNKTLLKPFVQKRKSNRDDFKSLSKHELDMLRAKAGLSAGDEDGSWCWKRKLWQCTNDSSFEEWICSLVPSIISCCFKKGENNGPMYGDFFLRCQKMCFLEHGFCEALFRYLILVLIFQPGPEGLQDVRRNLSVSFAVLMGDSGSPSGDQDAEIEKNPNTKALSLVVDTLDLLCRVSHSNFLSGPHKRNQTVLPSSSKAKSKTRTKGRTSNAKHNDNLPNAKPWGGIRFGVMLELDGLMVVKACIRARRHISALFFLDLALNARFGKSGAVFEELSNDWQHATGEYKAASNISGMTRDQDGDDNSETCDINLKESCLSAMSMIGKCFHELHEHESLDAIKTQTSAMKFVSDDFGSFDMFSSHSAPLETLRLLNTSSLYDTHDQPTPLLAAECMEAIGIHHVLHSYICGILGNNDLVTKFRGSQLQALREKWFESSLRTRQWGNLSLDQSGLAAGSLFPSQTNSEPLAKSKSSEYGKREEQGFFESLLGALESFQNDDMESCRALIMQGRLGILSDVAQAGGEESSLLGMVTIVDKLGALLDLENVASRMDTVAHLLQSWGLESTPDLPRQTPADVNSEPASGVQSGALEIDVLGFSSGIRELILRIISNKNRDNDDHRIFGTLTSHQWQISAQARQQGQPNVAEASMHRLQTLLRTRNQNFYASDSILRIRLEEAKILECRGDFSGSIRISKQVVDHLIQEEQTSGSLDSHMLGLLADAQISCGSWMTKYNVQHASVVLEAYLRPGAERSKRIYETDRNKENAARSTAAFLELGHIVSNLHEALSSRIQSREWKQKSTTLAHQENELQRLTPLVAEAYEKRKEASTGDRPTLHKQWEDLECYRLSLERDVVQTKREREKIENSVHEYLNLALQSFATALTHADTAVEYEMSKHVCRMISLWFSKDKDQEANETVNNLMAESFMSIPSFRFVPLTNQLVSRIEALTDAEKKQQFQAVLQQLIFKMCVDHPYHCLVPIIALSNGKNVGTGVSGRNASAFLENVGNSKVAAASAIMAKLKKDGPEFIGHLLDSYLLLTNAYIHLANAPTESFHNTKTKDINFSMICPPSKSKASSSSLRLDLCLGRKGSAIECPPGIITAPPPVAPDANYGEGKEDPIGGERVMRFETHFHITETGIHRPKVVICVGTKGSSFRQLVKGQDEIRQDAIMSQVFTYVNNLMMRRDTASQLKDPSVRGDIKGGVQRKLKMVTYQIVPLSPASGVSHLSYYKLL